MDNVASKVWNNQSKAINHVARCISNNDNYDNDDNNDEYWTLCTEDASNAMVQPKNEINVTQVAG